MSRRMVGVLAAGLALASTHGRSEGQGVEPGFARVDLEVGGKITEVLAEDFDGDGLQDLLVVRGREALIYFQERAGVWPSEPNQRFRFHPRTVLFDLGDVDGDGPAEVVLLQPDGLYVYRLQTRRGRTLFSLRPRLLVEQSAFLQRPVEDQVRRKEFLRDLDGDGDLDLALPSQTGFVVLANDGAGGFRAAGSLEVPPVAILNPGRDRLSSRLFASYWFANPKRSQWDADAGEELVCARQGELWVFSGDGAGSLPVQAAGRIAIEGHKIFNPNAENPFELDFTMPLLVEDLDHDGRADVSLTHVGQGTTRVFRNGPVPSEAMATPAQSLRAEGVTFLSFYRDLDGDGLEDLILPRMDELGVWTVLEVLVTGSVEVELLVFFQRSGSSTLFPDEPDQTMELEVPIAFGSQGDRFQVGSTVLVTLDGDYDGDGRKDLFVRTDSDEVAVFRGLAGRELSEDAEGETEVRDLEEYRFVLPVVSDLDGDGRDDVVLRFTSWDGESDALTILTSR